MSFTLTKNKGYFKLNYVDNFTAYKCDGVKKYKDGGIERVRDRK